MNTELNLKKISPFVLHDSNNHTMEDALFNYLDIKMHHYIKESKYEKILVIGEHDRTCSISKYEKTDKMFNWQRPTATLKGKTLIIKCFPGRDYVRHYASLISTFLVLIDKAPSIVKYIIPSEQECWEPILKSNIREIKPTRLAVLGYGLPEIANNESDWNGEGSFSWYKKELKSNDATFIGCRHSIWSDVGGRVVTYLASQGFKQIVYIGKLGSLNPSHIPNEMLATGESTFVEGEILNWENLFVDIEDDPSIQKGLHYNSPSIIFETKDWLNRTKFYDFVDPEIGQMAKAANSSNAKFSYMHIISNNLSKIHEENLSNERKESIVTKRKDLLNKIRYLIENNIR